MVRKAQRGTVENYVRLGVDEVARTRLDRGWYVEPTLFTSVTNDMRIALEEVFGAIAVVIPYDSEDEAVAIANDSPYGFAGSVLTTDGQRGVQIARQVGAGAVGVNS